MNLSSSRNASTSRYIRREMTFITLLNREIKKSNEEITCFHCLPSFLPRLLLTHIPSRKKDLTLLTFRTAGLFLTNEIPRRFRSDQAAEETQLTSGHCLPSSGETQPFLNAKVEACPHSSSGKSLFYGMYLANAFHLCSSLAPHFI